MKTLALLLASLALGDAPTDTWTGFRGNGSNVTAAKHLPVSWSPTKNIAWKADLPGYGQSSPVVWKNRVFVTAVSGKNRDEGFLVALDLKSGKKLWTHKFEPTQQAKWSTMVSRAAPTPLVDAGAVYALYEGGNLLAFSHDGKSLWSRSLFKEYGEFQNGHGLGASPTQTDDAIIVLIDHAGPSYLLAVDKKTGKNKWKTERKSRSSWASPAVTTIGGQQQIVVSSNGSVAGYDAASGKQLWEKKGISGNTVPSASVSGDVVLVGASVGRQGGTPAQAAESNLCLKLVSKDGKVSFESRWHADKATSSFATPLAYKGHAYFTSKQGVVYCLDLATGKEVYSERLDGSCWASPLGAGDHVYFFGKDGITTVLKTGPAFERVATNTLWQAGKDSDNSSESDKESSQGNKGSQKGSKQGSRGGRGGGYELGDTLYGVAAVDGALLLRTGSTLYCVANKK